MRSELTKQLSLALELNEYDIPLMCFVLEGLTEIQVQKIINGMIPEGLSPVDTRNKLQELSDTLKNARKEIG